MSLIASKKSRQLVISCTARTKKMFVILTCFPMYHSQDTTHWYADHRALLSACNTLFYLDDDPCKYGHRILYTYLRMGLPVQCEYVEYSLDNSFLFFFFRI